MNINRVDLYYSIYHGSVYWVKFSNIGILNYRNDFYLPEDMYQTYSLKIRVSNCLNKLMF